MIKKILVFLAGIFQLGGLIMVIIKPNQYLLWFFLALVLLLLIYKAIVKQKNNFKENFFFYLPLILHSASAFALLLLLESTTTRYLLIAFSALTVLLFYYLIFTYFEEKKYYQPFSLLKYYEHLSVITVFFSAIVLFGFQIFFNLNYIHLALILTCIPVLLFWQNIWNQKENWLSDSGIIMAFAVFFFEIISLMYWLPINYFAKGFLLSLLYFVVLRLYGHQKNQTLNQKKTILYLIVLVILSLITLSTTRWL